MSYLPNDKSKPVLRLSIYREPSADAKQRAEAKELIPFLLRLDQLVEIEDVMFGKRNDSPDFVFAVHGRQIGVELTTVNPALFREGGYRRRKEFREWQAQIKAAPQPVSTFHWGAFTLRESLASLKVQFQDKCEKVKEWNPSFSSKWLLLQLTEGSPFAELTGEVTATPGKEEEFRNHQLKVLFEVCAILTEPNPFDYVIVFAGCAVIAFPANGKNPLNLPTPRCDLLARGQKIEDSHLDWTSTIRHITRTGSAALEAW